MTVYNKYQVVVIIDNGKAELLPEEYQDVANARARKDELAERHSLDTTIRVALIHVVTITSEII